MIKWCKNIFIYKTELHFFDLYQSTQTIKMSDLIIIPILFAGFWIIHNFISDNREHINKDDPIFDDSLCGLY